MDIFEYKMYKNIENITYDNKYWETIAQKLYFSPKTKN